PSRELWWSLELPSVPRTNEGLNKPFSSTPSKGDSFLWEGYSPNACEPRAGLFIGNPTPLPNNPLGWGLIRPQARTGPGE
ncbi:MAG: hypothetical protein RQ842_10785, partial [Vulcanisaeta sp.]|nr:hypothetical protein [Vulcanisaeta sp.]